MTLTVYSGTLPSTPPPGANGDPIDGAVGLLRIGSSPYDVLHLIYDHTAGKWFSPSVLVITQGADQSGNSTGAYTDFTAGAQHVPRQVWLPYFDAFWDAGLRPQVNIAAWLNGGSGGANVVVRANIGFADDGDASASWSTNQLTTADVCSVTGSTDTAKVSGWQDFSGSAPTTKAHAFMKVQFKNTTTGGNFRAVNVWLRWVSA